MSAPFLETNDFIPCPQNIFLDDVLSHLTPPDIVPVKYENQNVITSVLVLLPDIHALLTALHILLTSVSIFVDNVGLLFTAVRVMLMVVGYYL
jgi:hypothetical protein